MLTHLRLKRLNVALAVIFLFTLSISAPIIAPAVVAHPYNYYSNSNNTTFRTVQEPSVAGTLNDTSITYQTHITRNKKLYLTIVVGSDDAKTLNTPQYTGFALLFDAVGNIVGNATTQSVYSGLFLQVVLFIPPHPEPGTWHFRLYLQASDGRIFASNYMPVYVTNAPPIIVNFTQIQIRGFTYSIVGINMSVKDDGDLMGLVVSFSLLKPNGKFYKSNTTVFNIPTTEAQGIALTVRIDLSDWESGGWQFIFTVTDREGAKTTKGPFSFGIVSPFVRSPLVLLTILGIFTIGLVYAMRRFIR